jgi:hypothetical protein
MGEWLYATSLNESPKANGAADMRSVEVTAVLLARGLLEVYDLAEASGKAVQQDASLPVSARRAMTLLSRLCLETGAAEDLGGNIHDVMHMACAPFRDWGLRPLAPPFPYADVSLIDRDLGVPTEDCREMARQGGSEVAAHEELQHEALRTAVAGYPPRQRSAAYTAIRELVVRRPVIRVSDLLEFVTSGGHYAATQAIQSFYRPIPQAALFGGAARLCGHCGSLLWPERDVSAHPDGRCRIRQCRLAHPGSLRGEDIAEPGEWKLATAASLAFWVGPGLDEIRIHDALLAAGRASVLYPEADAADVGVDELEVGIDVKTYASPVVLAARLSHSVGRLGIFRERILAVPDDKIRLNPRYLEQLRASYCGTVPLRFMTSSQAIRELAR